MSRIYQDGQYWHDIGDVHRLMAALRDVIAWVPGREYWHTDAAEEAVTRARAVMADIGPPPAHEGSQDND